MDFKISQQVTEKLKTKHNVTLSEVLECFANRTEPIFEETNPGHKTEPEPTMWFISETDTGRILKVVYVQYEEYMAIKTAFEPSQRIRQSYKDLCDGNIERT